VDELKMFVDRRGTPELKDKPGLTHALVIGTSAYRHVEDGDDYRHHQTFGLKRLKSSCLGTFAFARWLANEYKASAPLATLQLLLSPTDAERTKSPELNQAILDGRVQKATSARVKESLRLWRKLCDDAASNVAILYACGHGVRDLEGVGYILLEDFAAEEDVLNGSLNLRSVRKSMGYMQAETQIYFADACRVKPLELDENGNPAALGAGVQLVIDKKRKKKRTRRLNSVTFYSTSSDKPAFESASGDGTLFSKALIDCVKRYAADRPSGTLLKNWRVTLQNLNGALQRRVKKLALAEHKEQLANPAFGPDFDGDTTMHFLPLGEPKVPVSIQLIPDAVFKWATGQLFTVLEDETQLCWAGSFPTNPCKQEVQPGQYTISIDVGDGATVPSQRKCSRSFVVPLETETDSKYVPVNLSP
jgi:hypothetical protein